MPVQLPAAGDVQRGCQADEFDRRAERHQLVQQGGGERGRQGGGEVGEVGRRPPGGLAQQGPDIGGPAVLLEAGGEGGQLGRRRRAPLPEQRRAVGVLPGPLQGREEPGDGRRRVGPEGVEQLGGLLGQAQFAQLRQDGDGVLGGGPRGGAGEVEGGAGRPVPGQHADQQGRVGGSEAGGGLVQQLGGLGEGAVAVEGGDPLGEGAEVGVGGGRWGLLRLGPGRRCR